MMALIQEESNVRKPFCSIKDNIKAGSSETQILIVLGSHESKWIFCLITYNTVIIYCLRGWITSTNSIALSAYVNTIVFNIFALLVCLTSEWVSRNSSLNRKLRDSKLTTLWTSEHLKYSEYCPSSNTNGIKSSAVNFVDILNTNDNVLNIPNDGRSGGSLLILGDERYEVLALFVSACLILTFDTSTFISLIQRFGNQPNIQSGRLGFGTILGVFAHLGTIFAYPDAKLNHVVCTALPCPTWRGRNPIICGNMISAIILFAAHIVIHFWNFHVADTVAAFVVIGLTTSSMLPLAIYTSKVLVQRVPHHMVVILDRCLREALNIDGVVEFRNERFWMRSFGKLEGNIHVRIRQNANKSHVMKNIIKHLSQISSSLILHEFHDRRLHRTPFPSMIDTEANIYPPEYYINEILPNLKYENLSTWHEPLGSSSNQLEMKVMKTNQCFDMKTNNNNNPTYLTTFAGTNVISTSISSSNIHTVTQEMTWRRDDKFTTLNFHHDEKTMKFATILYNENVRVNNYLYRE